MKIDITNQIKLDSSFPIYPVHVYTGSSLPIEIVGVPKFRGSATVTGVKVAVTNADGVTIEADTVRSTVSSWCGVFAAANFARYGRVDGGVLITLKLNDGGVEKSEKIGRGLLEVIASSPSAEPGDPTAHYQAVGDDEYVKSVLVGTVQHYKKIVISYNAEMADWGFDLEGDYIISDGSFIPAN